jgi:hypothetical protein
MTDAEDHKNHIEALEKDNFSWRAIFKNTQEKLELAN